MGRCFLSGLDGDAINIVLAAAAANLRKLLAAFRRALRGWLAMRVWLAVRARFAWPPGKPELPRLPVTIAA